MRNLRLLRMLAGQVKSPSERQAERQARKDRREMVAVKRMGEYAELIQRRERGDPDLPPMPYDFVEQERRRREGQK